MLRRGFTQAAVGQVLGVSKAAVSQWLSGKLRPQAHHREALELWSRGAVPAEAWLTDEEAAAISAVEPVADSQEDLAS